ncbi:hypothetical protein VPH35_086524 [Triticum aestivum]
MSISNPSDVELLCRVSVRPRRRQIRLIRPPPVAAEARSGAPAQLHALCEEMGTSRPRSRVGARRRHPLLPRQSSSAAASSGYCCSASTSVRSACGSQAPTHPFPHVSSPATDSWRTSGRSRPPAAPTMGVALSSAAPPTVCVAPSRLPPPSARGFVVASLASRKAAPTMHGQLVMCEVPSTLESQASSNLVLATPTHIASPIIAAGDGGHVTGPSYHMRAGELLAALGAFDALATDMVSSWSSFDDDNDEDDEDGVELAPQTPLASKCSSGVSVEREAATCKGWQEVRPRHGPHRLVSPALASSPRPISAWLHGRCCRCLVTVHHAAKCRDPFRCSRCLGSDHRACECRNAWRPLSLLDNPSASSLSHLDTIHHLHPPSCQARLLERAEVALCRLSPMTAEVPLPPMSPPIPKPVVDFEGDKNVDLYGCFSPRASGFLPRVGSSLTPHVLPDFEGEATAEVVSQMLQIMPELHVLCGEPVSPLSMEQLRLDSLQTLEPCQASNNLPLNIMERRVLDVVAIPSYVTIGQVMLASGMTIEPLVLAPTSNSNALLTKELCDLLASVEVARPGLGRSIACRITGAPIKDKQKKVGKAKSGAKDKTSLAT